jgi:hypothetical protein
MEESEGCVRRGVIAGQRRQEGAAASRRRRESQRAGPTHVKNGAPPSMRASLATAAAARCISTSAGVANCGMRVSSLVLTRTVRDSEGSTWAGCVLRRGLKRSRGRSEGQAATSPGVLAQRGSGAAPGS